MTIVEEILRAIQTDDTDDSDRIVHQYENANDLVRGAMDYLMISVCGYSLPTLAERAGITLKARSKYTHTEMQGAK